MSEALGRVTAFVLAGGFGSRLRAAIPDRQKVVAPVGGRPVLTRILDQLAGAGVRRAVLGVGYLADQVRDLLGQSYDGMELVYSEEPEPLGTAGALRHARGLLDGDPVLVLNGDSYVEANLAAFLAWHRARRATASLMLARVPDPGRYGTVEADPSGRVTAFREKAAGATGPAAAAWVNAGVYLLGRPVIDALPARVPISLERDVFPTLVDAGLSAYRGGGRFIDIGTPESYTEAQAFFSPAPRAEEASRPATRPFILLDRDGTLIEERHYLSDPGGVALLPGVVDGLRALRAEGFALVVATNQAGVGRGSSPRSRSWRSMRASRSCWPPREPGWTVFSTVRTIPMPAATAGSRRRGSPARRRLLSGRTLPRSRWSETSGATSISRGRWACRASS